MITLLNDLLRELSFNPNQDSTKPILLLVRPSGIVKHLISVQPFVSRCQIEVILLT